MKSIEDNKDNINSKDSGNNKNDRNHTAVRNSTNTKKRTPKQIAALLCVILLAAVYLLTLLFACLDFPGADRMFAACLYASIGLPLLLWIYIWLYGIMKEKQTDASADTASSVCTDKTKGKNNDIY